VSWDHLSALPALGHLGEAPPIGGAALLARVAETVAEEVVATVLLEDDLRLRDSHLGRGRRDASGAERENFSPAVLSPGQAEGREPLPYPLAAAVDSGLLPGDGVWAAYYQHAADVARRTGSSFLAAWVAAEVGLRNAMATARARALGLEPSRYVLTPELGSGAWDEVVAEWSAAPDPLMGWKAVMRARWKWLEANNAWFSFTSDELAAYAAGLSLLRQWQRVMNEAGRTGAERP
jgi:hypothetical protein